MRRGPLLPALLLAGLITAALAGCATSEPEPLETPSRTERLAAGCNSCHGPEGTGSGAIPALRGQSEAALRARLEAWAASEEAGDADHVMVRFAHVLDRADMDALAAWYARDVP